MASLFKVGTALRGRLSTYSIVQELYRAADEGAVFLATNQNNGKCIVKSIRGHWRSYDDFHDRETITIVNYINIGPPEKPFHRVTAREVPPADSKFIRRIMKLDPRDRPTTEQLLADEWFTEESEDTRGPVPEKPQAANA